MMLLSLLTLLALVDYWGSNMNIYFRIIIVMVWMLFFSAHSQADIKVILNNNLYSYSVSPRLVEVLSPVAFDKQWYWPESKLFRSNTDYAQQLRTEIINLLKAEKANQESNNSSYENIINQIGSWELADRIKVEIDFELARISAQHNPRLESGEYQLILSERPSNLYIFGAIEKPINTHYIDNTCVKDILSSLKFMHLADLSFIYIISPRGKVGKYGIANWNNECVLPMPGSTIYIPLQERLFSNQEKIINRKIVELATNRVVAK